VLSAIYLLWAYQRVAFGEVTVEKNRSLRDASGREKLILAVMAVVIIIMGVASPMFTRRMAVSTDNMLQQMDRAAAAHRLKPGAAQTQYGSVSLPAEHHLLVSLDKGQVRP